MLTAWSSAAIWSQTCCWHHSKPCASVDHATHPGAWSSTAGRAGSDLACGRQQQRVAYSIARRALGNGEPAEVPPTAPPSGEWDDWGDWGAEDDWGAHPGAGLPGRQLSEAEARRRRLARRERRRKGPRDEYLRPMVDVTGIKYRLGLDTADTEARIREEFEENQLDSRAAVRFAGVLVVVPLLVGLVVSRLLAEPFFEVAQRYNPEVFALTDKKKVEGAKEVHKHELRLRMDAALGRAPPITEPELQAELRREAVRLADEYREANKAALLNLLSDSTAALTLFAMLLRNTEGRTALFSTCGRVISGLSDTAKAFLIIAGTDILLGYHSEEGWTAAIHLITGHYGYEVEEGPIYAFVAIVPVTMDAFFKLWIFRGLNRQNPASAVTLKNMDRH